MSKRVIVVAETAEAKDRYKRMSSRWNRYKGLFQSFRKGSGLTPDKAANATTWLLEGMDVSKPSDLYPLICATLDSMNQGERYVQALRNAFFGSEGRDLTTRREIFGAKYGINAAQVASLEDKGLEELLQRLAKRTQSEVIEAPTPEAEEEPSIRDLLLGLTKAIVEQTAVLREISTKLD